MIKKIAVLKFAFALAVLIVGVAFVFLFPAMSRDIRLMAGEKLNSGDYWQQALEAQKQEDWVRVIESIENHLEYNPKDVNALRQLVDAFIKAGNPMHALEYAQQLTILEPAAAENFYQLGLIYNIFGNKEAAVENYQKAVELNPQYSEAHFNLGFIYETDGQLLKAVNSYDRAVESGSSNAQVYYNLGNVNAGLQREEQAVAAYQRAVELDPNHMDSRINLAILLTQRGEFQAAINYLDEARMLGYQPPEEFLQALESYRETNITKN